MSLYMIAFCSISERDRIFRHTLDKYQTGVDILREKIFREGYTDRLSSTEQLDSYIKILNPKLWILLTVMIIVMAYLAMWSYTENRSVRIPTACSAENGEILVYISENDKAGLVQLGDSIALYVDDVDKCYGDLISISDKPTEIQDDADRYFIHLANVAENECGITANALLTAPCVIC